MALLKPDFITRHPIVAGLIWSVGFIVLFPLSMSLFGRELHGSFAWTVFVVATVAGGIGWGYSMKRRLGGSGGAL